MCVGIIINKYICMPTYVGLYVEPYKRHICILILTIECPSIGYTSADKPDLELPTNSYVLNQNLIKTMRRL